MKQLKLTLNRHLELILLLVVLVIILSSCGGNGGGPEEPSEQDLAFEKLSGAWTLNNGGSINLDGNNVSANYAGFTLSFTDGSFTTTNAGDLFPASGTWEWVGEATNQIRTGRGKVVTISTLTTSSFQFSFTKNASNAAAGIDGNYVIALNK
jgi:hypothetical protein